MNQNAVRPVAAFALAAVLVTSAVVGTLEAGTDLPPVYAEATSNGGMAVVLAALLLLFEWLPYEEYRRKEPMRIVTDAVLVFAVAAVVTAAVVSGQTATGLDDLGVSVGTVAVDFSGLISGVAAFAAAVYVFYARNREYYRPPGATNG